MSTLFEKVWKPHAVLERAKHPRGQPTEIPLLDIPILHIIPDPVRENVFRPHLPHAKAVALELQPGHKMVLKLTGKATRTTPIGAQGDQWNHAALTHEVEP